MVLGVLACSSPEGGPSEGSGPLCAMVWLFLSRVNTSFTPASAALWWLLLGGAPLLDTMGPPGTLKSDASVGCPLAICCRSSHLWG